MKQSGKATVLLLFLNLVVLGIVCNWIILDKEEHLRSGRRVLLEVRQYDPRSLFQGDYMALTYSICAEIDARIGADARGDGQVVLQIDADDVGHLQRLHTRDDSAELAADEQLLHYRIRWGRRGRVRAAAEEYFFQEGMAKEFERARFAELRVDVRGRSVLVALYDAERRRLGSGD